MSYATTAQFDALVNESLDLGQRNVYDLSGVALIPGGEIPLIEGEDYTADLAAGTVTLLRKQPGSHVFFRFAHNNAPPPMPEPLDVGAEAADTTDRTALQTAVGNLRQYVNASSPTAAQTTAALKLTIRLVLALARRAGV